MGINTEIFLSEKDRANATVRPSLDHECSSTQTAPSQVDDGHPDDEDDKVINGRADQEQDHGDHDQKEFRQKEKDQEDGEDEAKSLMSSSSSSSFSLQIKLPEFKVEDNDELDGFKTPTSSDCRIPLIPKCPPAPRKSKPLPPKRKASAIPEGASCGQQRIKIDLSKDMFESLFPILHDDHNSLDHQQINRSR